MQTTSIPVFCGVPTFFRAQCRTASQGGAESYHSAGYTLARHMSGLEPYDVESDEWAAEIERFLELADDAAVLKLSFGTSKPATYRQFGTSRLGMLNNR
jgi:hypothetical protein